MLRVQFEEDLEKLHNQFYAMGNEVLSQINRTVRAFVTHDRELARQVIEDDAEVNEYEVNWRKISGNHCPAATCISGLANRYHRAEGQQ